MARLPPHRLRLAPRRARLRRTDPHLPPRSARRRHGRPLEPLPRPRSPRRRSRCSSRPARRARPQRGHPGLGGHRAERLQGLIDAFDMPVASRWSSRWWTTAPIFPTRSRSTRRWSTPRACSDRRSPAVLIAAVGEGWCFFVDAVSYGAVHPLGAPHAPRRAAARAEVHARAPRDGRRVPLRERIRADPRAAAAARRVGPRGEAFRRAPAGHRARGDARRRRDPRALSRRPPASARSPARSTSPRVRASSGWAAWS